MSEGATQDSELRRITRVLADVAHTLEPGTDVAERISRTLLLTGQLVPNRRCALLSVPEGLECEPSRLYVTPRTTPEDEAKLQRILEQVRALFTSEQVVRSPGQPSHLSLPVVGFDDIIGVLRVEAPEGFTYELQHLRLLSVVTTMLGSYLQAESATARHLEKAKELAAERDFEQLLAGVVSHDLRTPLTVIRTVGLKLEREAEDDRQRRNAQRLLSSAARAERIVTDLLDVTRARVGGGVRLSLGHADLRRLLEDAIEEIRLAYPGRDVQLEADAAEPLLGEWDGDRLVRVVTNLLSNALRYGSQDTPVRVAVQSSPTQVELRIHNQGNPIPEHVLPNLFQPFQRGISRDSTGLGLGLYIVERIVRAHGGEVEAQSGAEAGTTFVVRLPRVASARQLESPRPELS